MSKVAVVLSGCGVYDGSEIYESTLTLLALSQKGVEVRCYAPDRKQHHVIHHGKGEEMNEQERSVLIESCRLARGEVHPLTELAAENYDALIFPGGFGAAKNLCDFAFKGAECQVEPEVERVLKDFHEAGKPIGLLCIAPVLAAKVFGGKGVTLTIGNDEETAAAVEAMGAKHETQPVTGVCVDETNKIVTSPAYMLGQTIAEVHDGIQKFVSRVLSMT